MNVAEFFTGQDDSAAIFETLQKTVEDLGTIEIRSTTSQISFRQNTAFAFALMPEEYLCRRQASPVLSLTPRRRGLFRSWKEIRKMGPDVFIHFPELFLRGSGT